MMDENRIVIDEKNFIGKGRHKKTYCIPKDKTKCIKVAYSDDGLVDLLREIKYRALRVKKGQESTMLPKYYGEVKTNYGNGFVFELVEDFDGRRTMSFQDYLDDRKSFEENLDMLCSVLKVFKKCLFEERLLTMGLFPENILIQHIDKDNYYPRLINDMGCANLIKLEYYFDYFTVKKIERRWRRFCDYLRDRYKYEKMNYLLVQINGD